VKRPAVLSQLGNFGALCAVALSTVCGCVGPSDEGDEPSSTEAAATSKEDETVVRTVRSTAPSEILRLFLSATKFSDVIKNTSDTAAFPDSDGTDMLRSQRGSIITLTTERFYPLGTVLTPAKWRLVAILPDKVSSDGSFTMNVEFYELDGIGFTADGTLVWKFEDRGDGHTRWTETIKAGFTSTKLIHWGHGQLMDGAAKNMALLAAKARSEAATP
jgi:hypothetical protein